MNGSIRKRGNAWEIRFDGGYDADGKRVQKSITVKGTKAEAQRQLRGLLATHDKGIPINTSKLTVAEYLERWLRDYVIPNTRPRTSEGYKGIIRRYLLPALGHIQLAKLQPADLQGMEARLLDKGLSPRTVLHTHRVLFTALKHAVKWGLIWRNPAEAVNTPKAAPKEALIPNADGVTSILELAKETPYHALLHFLAFTGCRRGEAVGLRWQDVDLDNSTASIVQTLHRVLGRGLVIQPPKSAKGRRAIALDAETLAVLRAHRTQQLEHRLRMGEAYQDQGLVFADPLGRPLDPNEATRTFRTLARRTGLEGVRLHDLRHFHASALLQAGTHPKIVQERLGHATISVTLDTYSHVLPGLQEQAATAFATIMSKAKRPNF